MQEILSNVKGTPIFGAGDFADQARALVENIQRKNLAPLEEARAIQKLTEKISFSFSNPSVSPDSQLPTPDSQLASARTQEEIAKGLGKRQPYISEMLQIATLTQEELSKLSDSDKLKKDKLLQLLKSRDPYAKKAEKQAPDPFAYVFKRNTMTLKGGKLDLENAGEVDLFISKMEDLIVKIREKRSGLADLS